MLIEITKEIINGRRLNRNEDVSFLLDSDLQELCKAANDIRERLCGNHVDLCSIINGRSGSCSENCKFCAQSAYHKTGIEEYEFLPIDEIVEDCRLHEAAGIHRYSTVTAGRTLTGSDFERAVAAYARMHEECPDISLCGSHGLLTEKQLKELYECGVIMYHCNLETSRRFFPLICSTHSFDDKIATIKAAQRAGLMVCSGGIIGMGETFEDRLDMAFELAELGVNSIPLNALTPIKGTSLENNTPLTEEEILRTVAIFRFINPTRYIRLAAGRNTMQDNGKNAFFAGANATITGNMLTTSGNNIAEDKALLQNHGFII